MDKKAKENWNKAFGIHKIFNLLEKLMFKMVKKKKKEKVDKNDEFVILTIA